MVYFYAILELFSWLVERDVVFILFHVRRKRDTSTQYLTLSGRKYEKSLLPILHSGLRSVLLS